MKHSKTRIIHAGRDTATKDRLVNPPVHHASTILFNSVAQMRAVDDHARDLHYGRMGTKTTHAVEDLISDLEGAHGCVLYSSGLAAITMALLSFVKTGDHILIVETSYGPTRHFCIRRLRAMGVEVEFYAPTLGDEIESLIKSNTKLIFCESPGSISFEIQDIPAICKVAKKHKVLTMLDNTWGSSLCFNGLDHGIDVQLTAATKYYGGHADVMAGVASSKDKSIIKKLRSFALDCGQHCAPDDSYLLARGIRTLAVRLPQHEDNALVLAKWLAEQDFVLKLLHPAFDSCRGHQFYKRDFNGCNGLFGVIVKPVSEKKMMLMVDNMQLFKIGYSWGGFESLVLPYQLPADLGNSACQRHGVEQGLLLRFHAGLENSDDLLSDMQKGFTRLYA